MPKPYVAHQKMFDAALPHGNHYYWKAHKLPPLSDEIIAVVVEHARDITSPLSTIPIFCSDGAVSRVPNDATAFAYRNAAHDINIVAAWLPDDREPDRHVEWVRSFYAALEPFSRGVYVNFTNDDPPTGCKRPPTGRTSGRACRHSKPSTTPPTSSGSTPTSRPTAADSSVLPPASSEEQLSATVRVGAVLATAPMCAGAPERKSQPNVLVVCPGPGSEGTSDEQRFFECSSMLLRPLPVGLDGFDRARILQSLD